MRVRAIIFTIVLCIGAVAQTQEPNITVQREAMKKLAFLTGKWRGPASVIRGPGGPIRVTQTEDVQFKLDGLVLLIEGEARDPEGKRVFGALATVVYDDATATYRFRAYNDGRYLDTELTVAAKGFSWGYAAGPLKVVNTMRLNESGEWAETTETIYGSTPPRRSFEMKLQRQP